MLSPLHIARGIEPDPGPSGRWIDVRVGRLDETEPDPSILAADELERATRFRTPQLRHRFLAGRTLLRGLLAEITGVGADELVFKTNAHGKPSLATGLGPVFNVSRSEGVGLFAVACAGSVGIDIEHIRPIDSASLANRFFSHREQQELEAFQPGSRLEAFFDIWVRKEAVIKADGRGLSIELDSFSVAAGDDPVVTDHGLGGLFDMDLWSLNAGDHVRAAVAWAPGDGGRAS